jgi:LEA14-like dessication related protein
MKIFAKLSLITALLGLIISCKTVTPPEAPKPEPKKLNPESVLTFVNVEAENPETLYLDFNLDLGNTLIIDVNVLFQNPELLINGMPADISLFSIELPQNVTLMGQERKSIPLRLVFYASEYEKNHQHDFDEYELALTIPVQHVFPDITIDTIPTAAASFPRVRKPEFHITMIKIMQAELINTRFQVSIKVDNPNHFPVELSSFNYELYGDGRFWVKGAEKDILIIPAKESSEIDLFLTMNFTNMRRNVLDQVIAMTEVQYRFEGSAGVETGAAYLPRFGMDFKLEGYSEVVR